MAARPQHYFARYNGWLEFYRRRNGANHEEYPPKLVRTASALNCRAGLMRILQVVTLLSPDLAFGGPARVALNQCAELIHRGHEVTLAAASRGYTEAPYDIDGVPVRLFPAGTMVPRTGFAGLVAPGLTWWANNRASEFDLVHIHLGRDLVTMPTTAIVRRNRTPFVLQTHGMVIPSRNPLARPLDALLTRRLLRNAGAVLYLTNLERRQLCEVARAVLPLVQLANGVPVYPPSRKRTGVPEVIFAARLDARKRPVLFVEMAKSLLARGFDARFTLIGPDEGEGRAVITAIGDESRISWEGPIDPVEMPNRLASGAVSVLTSEREPYPMSILEAMSVGIPVVVCDDCGLAPMIARTGSGLVAAGTVDALADAVGQALNHPGDFGIHARETITREFGMEAIGSRLTSIYEQALTREEKHWENTREG